MNSTPLIKSRFTLIFLQWLTFSRPVRKYLSKKGFLLNKDSYIPNTNYYSNNSSIKINNDKNKQLGKDQETRKKHLDDFERKLTNQKKNEPNRKTLGEPCRLDPDCLGHGVPRSGIRCVKEYSRGAKAGTCDVDGTRQKIHPNLGEKYIRSLAVLTETANKTKTINEILEDRDNIEKSFDYFHKLWINYYENKKKFYFVFDTTKLKAQNIFLFIEYSYKLINIIDYFKKYEIQYLKSSILIIDNEIINNLFYSIFLIKKPLAEIFIIKSIADLGEKVKSL